MLLEGVDDGWFLSPMTMSVCGPHDSVERTQVMGVEGEGGQR